MKVFFIILILSLNFGFNAFADDSDIQNAPQDIIRTLAKVTNNFTTENGKPMQTGSSDFEKMMLVKLQEPEFRNQFVIETLKMHEQMLEQLKKDMIEALKGHTSYEKYRTMKSLDSNGTRINIEYSHKQEYTNLFEELNLLKLMFASMAFAANSEEQSTLRAKIVREMAVSQSYISDINKLKREIIKNDVREELNGLKNPNTTNEQFEKYVEQTTAERFEYQKITATLLQFELAQFPTTQAKLFDLIYDSKDPQKLIYVKDMVLERIKIISLSMYAHLFPTEVQEYFIQAFKAINKSSEFTKNILSDSRISFSLDNVAERIKAIIAKPSQNPNFKRPITCSKLFE